MPPATIFNVSPTLGPLPPSLQTQFDGIVDLLIVETVFPTLLIPMTVCLFMFTRPEIQRKPVFIFNVLSIMFGLVFGGIAIAIISRSITGRLFSPEFATALAGLYFLIPVCVQCILFVRIFAVYPPRVISRLLAISVYGTLFTLTIARVINICILIKVVSDASRHSPDPWAAMTAARHVSSALAELSMALVYDTMASALFLFRLREGGAIKSRRSPEICVASNEERRLSYPARLRALFWIALTNFVVPVIFNVVLLIVVPNEDFGNIVAVFALASVSVYVHIVSGLLATLWCTGTSPFSQARGPDPMSTLKFAPASAMNSNVLTEPDSVNTSSATESSGPC